MKTLKGNQLHAGKSGRHFSGAPDPSERELLPPRIALSWLHGVTATPADVSAAHGLFLSPRRSVGLQTSQSNAS